jgi:protein-disulfide isomerase
MVVLAFAIAVAAAIALVVVALAFRDKGSDASPATTTPAVDLTGIPQQGTVLGKSSAKVKLIEYADAQCPGCRFYTEEVFPVVVAEYIRPGKVTTEYRGFPFIGSDSVKALRFILAAGLQDRLWQLQEALYRHQGAENSGWVTDDLIRAQAAEIPGLDVDKLFADAASNDITREAEEAEAKGRTAGIPGTPTFFIKIGDQEPYFIQAGLDPVEMRAALDDALAG